MAGEHRAAVDGEGAVFWNKEKMADNRELLDRIKEVAVLEPQPEVHVRGDRNTGFEFIGRVTVSCQRDGIQKVAFITEPVSGAAQQE
ncbi:ExbD/TolR family protein [Tepidicaulis sp. LMO-SS28]|uniref:ExbD/TolR family protein n=1 Tax=Tepidicaulis sp. LMO-SS28 TaxID=3447455 RepID=UPI003EE1FA42